MKSSSYTFCRRLAFSLLAMLCLTALAHAQEQRTWSDKSGKYKIEGKLKGIVDGKAVLLKADGKEVKIDVKKLSDADQKYIEAHPAEDGDNPFESSDSGDTKPAPMGKTAKVDWTEVSAIAITPTADAWKFMTPIAGPAQEPLKNKAISLPPKADFFEGVTGMAVNYGATRVVVVYGWDKHKKGDPTTRIVLCDLAQGKTLMKATTTGSLAPVALNDKGTQVLMRRNEFGFGNADRLEIWNLSPQGIEKALVFHPNDDAQGGGRDVKWGAYLEDDRFVLLGANGRLAAWKANSAEPEWSLQVDGGSRPALSPDRKLLAFSTGQQTGVLDLKAGEVAALQSTGHTPFPQLCFSPDGSRLACFAHTKLLVWNFADGKLYRDIPVQGIHVGGDMIWPHPQYLLLGKAHLFDVENQVKLWTYQGGDAVETVAPGQCAFVVSNGHDKPGALVIGPVPTPTFEKTLATAKKAPDFFVLKPGTTVKLSLDQLQDAQEREKVRTALTAKLKERQCEVGPNGTIELVAVAEPGQEIDQRYHGFGVSPFKSYKVREYISKLSFVYQGKVTWQTQGSSVPGFIQLKEGETIEQILRRSERPNYDFYGHVELPKMLMKPSGQDGLGTSHVTVAGVP